MSYCSRTDILNRLSSAGLAYVADDDLDGTVGSSEHVAATDEAIAVTDEEINAALTPWFDAPLSSAGGNVWLKYKAVDLAVEYLAQRRGNDPPAGVVVRADLARQDLERVRTGALRVPGLTYPVDGFESERHRIGKPRVANPGGR